MNVSFAVTLKIKSFFAINFEVSAYRAFCSHHLELKINVAFIKKT